MYKYILLLIAYMSIQFCHAQNKPQADTSKTKKDTINLKEVTINTGYYQIPKERATGSFDYISKEMINRSTGSNIIARLEGISSSLNFDRRKNNRELSSTPALRVRGLSTIASDESPLIVVDNFPYEGNIDNINPNDVESVTILKDAAAASIWGARAGNGVIVITTKQGRFNQKTSISLNSNVTLGNRPNLYYSKKWLPSAIVMGFEKELFDKNTYSQTVETALPAYVDLLFALKNNAISQVGFNRQENILQNTDARQQALAYLYQQSINQQYSLGINGGEKAYKYYLSAGLDNNRSFIIGNSNRRLNLNLQNTFKPFNALELTGGIWYTRSNSVNNGITISQLDYENAYPISPYTRLVDEQGNALAIPYQLGQNYVQNAESLGLLNWTYKPVEDRNHINNNGQSSELRMNAGAKFSFLRYFNANFTYQYITTLSNGKNHFDKNSYEVRNMVNSYTQANGTRIIPYGDILRQSGNNESNIHSGRAQLNYQQSIGRHNITGLAGTELRQVVQSINPGYVIYNYNPAVLTGSNAYNYEQAYPQRPSGSRTIPAPPSAMASYTDRYFSWFANAAYSYKERYTLSGSIRWDGSNLFGVKTNQKGVPLWSAGLGWEISKENFYKADWLPYLKIRATYGSAGNVNKAVTTYPVISYGTESSTKLPITQIRSAGNPALRWELVNTTNLGIDVATPNKRIQGSVEYYVKNASDLIGQKFMAPSSGIVPNVVPLVTNLINYANLQTRGLDVQLNTQNLTGQFKWETNLLFSYVRNKVTNYSNSATNALSFYFGTPIPLQVGLSRDVTYYLPWHGLNHNTGKPNIPEQYGSDYKAYLDAYPANSLLNGVTIPPYFGSVRNSFSFKGIQLSAVISFKTGYVFKRESIYPSSEYTLPQNFHADYFKRWKQPGDERFTDVPAAGQADTYLSQYYSRSAALITKGDHIRLQDISISYTLPASIAKTIKASQIRFYAYARNLGILWRANKQGLDPEYPNASYPDPASYAFGLNVSF
ncbi:TonB-linked SusC/RagA family outer membrane protein [Pedobacter africanus]|uniref:TonB-linked SusC/RagA family outer membrane protein n=1 Tax=Pedobacter africanus TaxID=151894 RepID=A0ACC6L4D7_9SPHI|nr:SusC/RagA family TonB-linked outer membrane protein [Pedobacter africanus]MDR6786474.1 TonB-linked SusC/RagA family outer membrane protein [Pedobacter africanus]